jgi:hypothetical protein
MRQLAPPPIPGTENFSKRNACTGEFCTDGAVWHWTVCAEIGFIRIPTGFGKTAGGVLAWLWTRVYQENDEWPRRLVLWVGLRLSFREARSACVKGRTSGAVPADSFVAVAEFGERVGDATAQRHTGREYPPGR